MHHVMPKPAGSGKSDMPGMNGRPYLRLLAMAILSFLAMYVLMYAMVDRFANVYPNLNQFYMAGLMAAPMVLIELLLMSTMYRSKTWNLLIAIASALAIIGFFTLIRQQAAVGDEQFLKSMIPHHASALLMCEQASLEDPDVKALCDEIMAGQQAEIDRMKAMLADMD